MGGGFRGLIKKGRAREVGGSYVAWSRRTRYSDDGMSKPKISSTISNQQSATREEAPEEGIRDDMLRCC